MATFEYSNCKVIQISTECLAQFAYIIISDGEACVVDPLRISEPYLQVLDEHKAKLKYIFLTHIHADYVGGHIPLAKKTKAPIVMGPDALVDYPYYAAKDSEVLELGKVTLKVWHTPGHTIESSCLLLREGPETKGIFTGDTLFLGDVGRPDLGFLLKLSPEELAGRLFDSLIRLKTLPDNTAVFPAHGAGSPCGKNIQAGASCTIGKQKQSNKAFAMSNKEEFIKMTVSGLDPPLHYFARDVMQNKSNEVGDKEDILKKEMRPVDENLVKTAQKDSNYLIIDARPHEQYIEGHIEGSINIPLKAKFGLFAGFIYENQKVIVVANVSDVEEAILRLARLGIENVAGYLEKGMEGWNGPQVKTERVSAEELEAKLKAQKVDILDVRFLGEYRKSHIKGTEYLTLSEVAFQHNKLDKAKQYHVYCGTGVRSLIAKGVLDKQGFKTVNVEGGWAAISKTGIPFEGEEAPSK